METRRTIAIGDVHGCYDELLELLDRLKVRRGLDRLIFLGDIVDRGPKVNEVVRLVMKGCLEDDWELYLGNHEEKHLRWAAHERMRREFGKRNPMKPFDEQRRAEHDALTDDEKAWLGSLPAFARFKDGDRTWIATHAGVPADVPIERQNVKTLVRTRYVDEQTGAYASSRNPNEVPKGAVYWALGWMGPESVVHGHIVFDEPRIDRQGPFVMTAGIDTGCCFGGSLTAAVYTGKGTPDFVSVKAARPYFMRHREAEE